MTMAGREIEGMAPYLFTFISLTVCSIFYFYAPFWRVRHLPGPPTIPFLGHLPLIAKFGPDIFAVLAKKYGPIYRFHLGRQPLIIVADPELCKEVGIKKFKSIPNRSLPSPIAGSVLHQKGLFFTRDSRWSATRNTVISLYQPSHLASLIPMMQSYIVRVVQVLSDVSAEEDVAFSDISLKLATDIIGQAAFGIDFALTKEKPHFDLNMDKESQAFIKEHIYSTTSLKMDLSGSFSIILGLIMPFLQGPFQQVLKRIPYSGDWRIDKTNMRLTKRLNEIVSKRASEKKESKDFLSLILNEREKNELARNMFTPDYISALTYEHLLAGSATTAFTLSSVVYLVAKHPAVEEKLLEEINRFPKDLVPTADDLQHKFLYLDQVIKEAMRFYTVSPLIARETSQAVEIGGYFLPKGTWVWIAPGVLSKDPNHFPDPHEFRPERFDPNCQEEKNRHPYAHIPFGLGPRACIGQKFSLQEIKLTMIYLYQNFVFRHSPKMENPLQFQYGIVLNFKYGVLLRVVRR
ncbi:hypothetical protein LUZ62_040338 [Rhynchospora pubera]|uniref:Cytochrome P450 n=1 Tax=Rhynchospora pubera TaxID=906938 RepID=A0AAV8FFP9_9POAL|nr:hypothetical protein LUZ62_040338 [Rhynchospora pubera]